MIYNFLVLSEESGSREYYVHERSIVEEYGRKNELIERFFSFSI